MLRSFLVTSEQGAALVIRDFHVNLWFLDYDSIYLELGLLLETDKQALGAGEIVLRLLSPFDCHPDSLENLHDTMLKIETLHLLFNDEVGNFHPLTYAADNRAFYVDFRSGRSFLLLKPEISSGSMHNVFEFRLTSTGIRHDELDRSLEGKEVLRCYIRFRYKVAVKSTDNIYFERGVMRSDILYDFRFNDLRVFENEYTGVYDKMVRIQDIYVFVIHPYKYRISLNASTKMRYIRLLESGAWGGYLPPLTGRKDKFLIYYWRENRSPKDSDSSFNLLVSFDAEERAVVRTLLAALLLTPTSILLLALPQYIRLEDITSRLSHFVAAVVRTMGGIGLTVVLGMVANSLWELAKIGFHSLSKKFQRH